jgi:hypothetical protein
MFASIPIWIQISIQVAAYLIIAVIFVSAIRSDVKILRVQMEAIKDNLKILNDSMTKVGDCLTTIAVQNNRLSNLEEDIRELKHGKGFIDLGTTLKVT